MIPKKDACIDIPDVNDYKFLEVFGTNESPDVVDYGKTTVYNQGEKHTPSTTYACTCYSAVHCVNDGNYQEMGGPTKEIDPVPVWSKALVRGAKINVGWSLQSATKLVMDMGYISGFTLCRGIDEVKQALAARQVLQTGSNKIDWVATKNNNNIIVAGTSYGHAFELCGYNNNTELLKFKNSYGIKEFDGGYFYLKYKDFGLLFSCYAYADKENDDIKVVQSKKRRDLAISLGYWNGERPNDVLSRYEAAQIAIRVGKVVKESKVWNGKTPNMPVTQKEYKAMLERASGKKITFIIEDSATITRGVASEWTVRLK